MKLKSVWYLGVMILGLAILAISCSSGILPGEPPAAPIATIAPPNVPHALEGRANCLLCHEKGVGSAPQYPSSHIGRPSDVCLTCHAPASTDNQVAVLPTMPAPPVEATPITISATEIYGAKCAACHGANRAGVPNLGPALTSKSLEGLSDAEIRYAISDGRTGTAMPPFKTTLSPEEIEALLQLIKSPTP